MRGNGIEHTTTTTGTGTLTLTAVSGKPAYDDVFGTSGTIDVEYTVLDASDIPIEGGVGSVDLSTMVLTRTEVEWTWSGTTYTSNNATALSLASGTKKVICGPSASRFMANPAPREPGLGTNGRGFGAFGIYNASTLTLTDGTAIVSRIYWPWSMRINRATVRFSTALGGAPSATYFAAGLYYDDADGLAGKSIAIFDSWPTMPLTSTAVNTSDALGSAVAPQPGWYWLAILGEWTGGTGSPIIDTASTPYGPMSFSKFSSAARGTLGMTKASLTALPTDFAGGFTTNADIRGIPMVSFEYS